MLSAVVASVDGAVDLSWEARPDVWLLVIALAAGYEWAIRRLGPRLGAPPTGIGRRRALFFAGLTVLWVAADWPVDTLGDDYMMSVHMVQYLALTLVASPLLLAGIPGWLFRELVRPVRPLLDVWSRPFVALLVFDGVLVLSHWPAVVELYTSSDAAHFALHAVWVVSAVVFWLPVLSPLDERAPLRPPLQMGYLFLSSVIPTIPASFLTWAEGSFYEVYRTSPKLWGLTAIEDQQLAGLIMKVGGGLLLWTVITVIFFRWAASGADDDAPVPAAAPGRSPAAGAG